jgi:putative heme iron utilization protein
MALYGSKVDQLWREPYYAPAPEPKLNRHERNRNHEAIPMAAQDPVFPQPPAEANASPGWAARTLVRRALKASLATLDAGTGHPYASLVTIATDVDGTPLFLISTLALHTKNIARDDRVSLLFDGTDGRGDPLAGGRVTLIGRAIKTQRPTAPGRFLARHDSARGYADFPDFAFYELVPERAHFIGGFGRIVDLPPSDLLIDMSGAGDLVDGHDDVVSHMNEDHAAAIELYATELAGAPGGPWRMTGIDPEGIDLVCDGAACRVPFAAAVHSPNAARQELIRFAATAREHNAKR